MSRHPQLYHWQALLAQRFPHLSAPYVLGLALWSLGMILARRCGLDSVVLYLAELLSARQPSLRQRLREFYKEAPAKAGARRGIKRRDFAVADCFPPLLAWVLSFFTDRRLALALDVTNLGQRFHVLVASVVYGGTAIPVAWKVLAGGQKEAWHPHWCDLLARLRAVLGPDWRVVVLTDRGLESARLFGAITAQGWHPLMRVKKGGKFRPQGWHKFYPFQSFAPRVGSRFAAVGRAYSSSAAPLEGCTLLACWTEGHAEGWFLLTDLPPGAANPCWYAFRAWIEQSFKVIKSSGLDWQDTRMRDPGRVERLWLGLAVATLWLVVLGAQVEATAAQTIGELPRPRGRQGGPSAPTRRRRRYRRQRLAARGRARLLGAWLKQEGALPQGKLPPDHWDEPWSYVPTLTELELCSQQTTT